MTCRPICRTFTNTITAPPFICERTLLIGNLISTMFGLTETARYKSSAQGNSPCGFSLCQIISEASAAGDHENWRRDTSHEFEIVTSAERFR